jgi:hypothetical protein
MKEKEDNKHHSCEDVSCLEELIETVPEYACKSLLCLDRRQRLSVLPDER